MSKQMIVAANLTDLHREPSFLSEMLTQVFNGTVLEILEEKDRWCFVRQTDGYQGWAHRPYLTTPPAPAATHIVCAPSCGICRAGGSRGRRRPYLLNAPTASSPERQPER